MRRYLVLFIAGLTVILLGSINSIYAGSVKAGDSHAGMTDMMPQQDASLLSGKVVETMNSGGYTYVNLDNNGKSTWVAVPSANVTMGQDISFNPGMVMTDFTSKSLGRTFDAIVFSGGVVEQSSKGGAHGSSDQTMTKAAPEKKAAAIKVDKASGSDAYTVAELYEKSVELDTRSVSVRGEVVKVSESIMGKNWVHIQDGTGTSAKGTNDILVTSQDLPSVGDIVTANGILAKDRDFGSGYKYAVIVEQTSIKK
jgi:hypothetical protein